MGWNDGLDGFEDRATRSQMEAGRFSVNSALVASRGALMTYHGRTLI